MATIMVILLCEIPQQAVLEGTLSPGSLISSGVTA